jgi:hypothetical protein
MANILILDSNSKGFGLKKNQITPVIIEKTNKENMNAYRIQPEWELCKVK